MSGGYRKALATYANPVSGPPCSYPNCPTCGSSAVSLVGRLMHCWKCGEEYPARLNRQGHGS